MGFFDQKLTRTVNRIHLFPNSISTANESFPLEDVHDLSYRPFSGGTGLFYLHTNQGVFTYEIDTKPTHFIQAFKNLRA
ncbi:hypothetical protein AU377_02500 [Sporosarcina sp. HYO08]|nr:hypothetical protein AU377_02500 [Sporosarcina sp. HYO08]